MIPQLRHVALLMFVLFAALLVNVNYLQVLRAAELRDDPRNSRGLIEEYQTRRGLMIGGDGETELAVVEETDGRLRYRRQYPAGPLYAHVTGYQSLVFGPEELERSFNDYLTGAAPERFARNLTDLLAGRERAGDDLRLSILPPAQQAAQDALGDRRGAVVALEPVSGDILALWSSPSYDPNRMSSHDRDDIIAYREELLADGDRPLINRAIRETYPPGSTFKLVTGAAALESGIPPDAEFDDPSELQLPQTTATIGNFGGGLCNDGQPLTLLRAMEVSCNTTFAKLGLDLGAEALIAQAEAFGFNTAIVEQVPVPADSRMPKELNEPQTAQSAIGQFDVRATPLQMAMIAAAIGNGGVLMTPHLVTEVTDTSGSDVATFDPQPFTPSGQADPQAISAQTAQTLTEMMIGVVERGSGTAAQIAGVQVAGKTGTAQTAEGRAPTVWFTGFAPAENPQVAVAVMIEDGGEVGSEATGGQLAAPVAKAVMEAALQSSGPDEAAQPDEDG
ncbi:D,D-transpeptidase PbpA [soil metagenome]